MSAFTDLLRTNRNYRFMWSGQIVSEVGDRFNSTLSRMQAFHIATFEAVMIPSKQLNGAAGGVISAGVHIAEHFG